MSLYQGLFTFVFLLFSSLAKAEEILSFPYFATSWTKLTLINQTPQKQRVWLIDRSEPDHAIETMDLSPDSQESLSLEGFQFSGHGLYLKVTDRVEAWLEGPDQKVKLKSVAPRLWEWTSKSSKPIHLRILNLHGEKQKLLLRSNDRMEFFLESPEPYETKEYILNSTRHLEIFGQGRLQILIKDEETDHWVWATDFSEKPLELPEGRFFLITHETGHTSFVIHLQKEDDLRLVDEALQRKTPQLLFAEIEVGYELWNKNWKNETSTPWGWKVKTLLNFNELGSISCDGSPTVVEEFLPDWLQSGRICFWKYYLEKEIFKEEMLRSIPKNRPPLSQPLVHGFPQQKP